MKTDYGVYILSCEEKIKFYTAGYAAFAFLGYIFYKSVPICLISGFAVFLLRERYAEALCRKRKSRLMFQFKDFLYSLSASVSSGRNMQEAMEDAYVNLSSIYGEKAPMLEELKIIINGIRNRESEEYIFSDFATRSKSRDISGFTDVYLAVRQNGGDMEKAIERTCEVLMDKISTEKDIDVLFAQKRLEAGIITAVPIVITALLNFTSSGYTEPLYTTFTGRVVMTFSLATIGFAYYLTEKITDLKI